MMNPISIINKYYTEGTDQYHILVEHSRDVAVMALRVVDSHPELQADRLFVEEAAMLHDIGIFLTDAESIACFGKEPYILHGYLGANILRKEGYPRHALVCERHTGSGLTPEDIAARQIALPEGIYTPMSIEEKIVCYADKFFSKTKLHCVKKLEAVRRSMLSYGADSLRRFDEMHAIFKIPVE
ncbi:HD domain-containing protein [Porphyromonas gulae]|uniref:HD domain-containing protein n=1 Tax=Porphyromonas gulae TaxID=111105 RepID=UPI0009B85458|nr:HD domain-containing protein [Porphyromonas gulae]